MVARSDGLTTLAARHYRAQPGVRAADCAEFLRGEPNHHAAVAEVWIEVGWGVKTGLTVAA